MAEIPQQPFDLGAPDPELPWGSNNIPDFNALPEPQVRAPGEGMDAPNSSHLAMIAQLTPEQQQLAHEWWPKAWNRMSPHLRDDGEPRLIVTIPQLFMHIEAEQKKFRSKRKPLHPADAQFSEAYTEWQNQCAMRNTWIESKNAEWRRRVAGRKTAMLEWDAYVEQARLEYQEAKATAPPPRPSR